MVIDEKDTYSICLMCYPQYIIVYQKSIMALRYASVPPFQMIVPVLFSSASISARRLVVVTPFLPYFCLDFYLTQPWLYSDLTSRISCIMFVFPCCSSRLGCRFVVVARHYCCFYSQFCNFSGFFSLGWRRQAYSFAQIFLYRAHSVFGCFWWWWWLRWRWDTVVTVGTFCTFCRTQTKKLLRLWHFIVVHFVFDHFYQQAKMGMVLRPQQPQWLWLVFAPFKCCIIVGKHVLRISDIFHEEANKAVWSELMLPTIKLWILMGCFDGVWLSEWVCTTQMEASCWFYHLYLCGGFNVFFLSKSFALCN